MAINIKNYVDISTRFPATDVAGRAFGGLVFTARNDITGVTPDDGYNDIRTKYNDGKIVYLSLKEVSVIFGSGTLKQNPTSEDDIWAVEPSDEFKFASGYYGYLSPSGRFASKLAFKKVNQGQTALEAFMDADEQPGNIGFGSFTFLSLVGDGNSSTTADNGDFDQLKACAEYNQATLGSKYLFVINRIRGDEKFDTVVADAAKFADYQGVCYVSGGTVASAFMPMAILGSTDYENGQVVNFMFKQFPGEPPTVTSDTEYTEFNRACVNFYGRTQTNGQTLDFFQRGFNTNGIDTAIYCNEMWFKSACETALVEVLTGSERLPANQTGVSIVKNNVIEQCGKATKNGTFMAKNATSENIREIAELLLSIGGTYDDATSIATSVGINGYSVYAYLDSGTNATVFGKDSEYYIVYYVFYGTADSIRYIKGNNVLIK